MRLLRAAFVPLLLALVHVASADEDVALVATVLVRPASYDRTLPEKVGALLPEEHRLLAFEAPGRLQTIVEEGQRVEGAAVVAHLDSALERAQLRRAELLLRDARSELARAVSLRESAVASPRALEAAETEVGVRLAERDAARERLEQKRLVAQFDGVVVERLLEPGEIAAPGTPVATLMNLDTVRLKVGVPGYQIGRVVPNARVRVTVAAFPGEEFEGVTVRTAAAAAQGTHLFEVEIAVPNPEHRLRPGMTARARIVTQTLDAVLVIPFEASVEREGGRVVFFVVDDRAHASSVSDALTDSGFLLLRGGPSFDELVVRGQRDLQEGDAVRVDNSILAGIPAR